MKKKWIETFDGILSVITKSDPINLIAEGAPTDEYDLLALEIFAFTLYKKMDNETLSKEITRLIINGFGSEQVVQQAKIQKIAQEILNL